MHLGAVTGGAPELTAIMVNAVGTRTLLHYLRHRGCLKIVTASSIAAVGLSDQGVPTAEVADSRRAPVPGPRRLWGRRTALPAPV